MSYPPTGYPSGPTKLRGGTPRKLGWIFLAVAVVLFVVGIIVVATTSLSKVNDFKRVSLSDTGTVSLSKGKKIVYYEAKGANDKRNGIPLPAVRLTAPSGKALTLDTLYGGAPRTELKITKYLTYSYNGHDGVAIYQFDAPEAGDYDVQVGSAPGATDDADIAFGDDIANGTIAGGLLVVGGILFGIAAIVLLIVGYVKRSRHKKELAQYGGGYYPPPPPGYGGYGYAPPSNAPGPHGEPGPGWSGQQGPNRF